MQMHHTLRLYSRHREFALRFYMFWARWTRLPLVGPVIRWVGNAWGRNLEGAYLLTADEAAEVVEAAEGLAVGPCTCRKVFANCDHPRSTEIVLGLSRNVFVAERPEDYREIDREEAKDILRDCRRRGLVHTIIKCRDDFYAMCNCCSCCCVPWRLSRQYGIRAALSRSGDIAGLFRQQQRRAH
jgi:hypothetical protein